MNTRKLCLVFGCDLSRDHRGQVVLGMRTTARLQAARTRVADEDEQIVVAAGYAPNYPDTEPMSRLMHLWLCQRGYRDAVILIAESFDTEGEVRAVAVHCKETGDQLTSVVSWQAQLPRIRKLLERHLGPAVARNLCYVPARGERPGAAATLLEYANYLFVLTVPAAAGARLKGVVKSLLRPRRKV